MKKFSVLPTRVVLPIRAAFQRRVGGPRRVVLARRAVLLIGVVLLGGSTRAGAQSSLPPLRQLGPVTAVAKDSLGAVSGIRALSNGQFLVNDIISRRVLLFDSTMTLVRVVADTTSATAN